MTQWQRLIQEGAHNSVSSAREIVISCRWREQDCKLTLHLDSGIQLMRIGTGGASSLLWSYPYERLKMSGDDGIRTLWLDFEDDGEQVVLYMYLPLIYVLIYMTFQQIFFYLKATCLKVFLKILHNFL